MMDLNYRDGLENKFENIKDLMIFSEQLLRFVQEKRKINKVWVTNVEYINDPKLDTMVTVNIDFTVWEKGESGYGTKKVFTNYRAKSFSVMNLSIA